MIRRTTAAAALVAALTAAGLATAGPAAAATRPAHPDRATCRAFATWYRATEAGYRPSPGDVARVARRSQYAGPALRGLVAHWAPHPASVPYIEYIGVTCARVA